MEGLNEKVTFAYRLEGSEGMSHKLSGTISAKP